MKKILLLLLAINSLQAFSQSINIDKGIASNSGANYTGIVNCMRYFPNYGVVICGNFDYGFNNVPPSTPISISENIVAIDSNVNFSSLGAGIHRPMDVQQLYYVDTIQGDLIAVGDIPGTLFRFNKATSTWSSYNLNADSTVRVCLGVSHSKVLLVGDFSKINNVSCHYSALYDIDSNTITPINLFPLGPSVFANHPWRDKEKIYMTSYNNTPSLPISVFNTNLLDVDTTSIPTPDFFYIRSIVAHDSVIYIAGLDGTVTSTISKYSNGVWSTFCNVQDHDCGLTYDAVNKELYASGDFTMSCGYSCNKIFKYNEGNNQYSCVANNVVNGFVNGMVIAFDNKFYGLMGSGAICTNMVISSVSDLGEDVSILLTPNPSSNELNINIASNMLGSLLNIYDVNGRIMLATQLQSTNYKLETTSYPSGIYVAEIKKGDAVKRVKWIKT